MKPSFENVSFNRQSKVAINLLMILISFSLSINIAFAQTYQTFNVLNYGADPTDNVDDVPAINSAIIAANAWRGSNPDRYAIIKFPSSTGVYLIASYTNSSDGYLNNYAMPLSSNLIFKGQNKSNCILKLADHMLDHYLDAGNTIKPNVNFFYGKNISNITFSDLTFDMNGVQNLVLPDDKTKAQPAYAIKIEAINPSIVSRNITVDNVIIKNASGHNNIFITGPGNLVQITNSSFINGGWNVGSPTIINSNNNDFSFLFSDWDSTTVSNVNIIQEYPDISLQHYTGGLEIHGSKSYLLNSYITGCYPAVYITSHKAHVSSQPTLQNVTVRNTQMLQCAVGVSFWPDAPINGVTIRDNYIQVTYPRDGIFTYGKFTPVGINVPNGDAVCPADYNYLKANNNTLTNISIIKNNINSVVPDNSSFYTTGLALHSLSTSLIDSNHISNMNYAGIHLSGSKWGMYNTTYSNNIIDSFRHFNGPTSYVIGYMVTTDLYRPNSDCELKETPTYGNITIGNNTFYSNAVTVQENSNCGQAVKTYACFQKMIFSLPQWYAYDANTNLKTNIFNVFNNTVYTNPNEIQLNQVRACPSACPNLPVTSLNKGMPVLHDNSADNKLVSILYPNPNNGNFKIEYPRMQREVLVSVFDIGGKKIYQQIFYNTQSSVIKLSCPKGVYFIMIKGDNIYDNKRIEIL